MLETDLVREQTGVQPCKRKQKSLKVEYKNEFDGIQSLQKWTTTVCLCTQTEKNSASQRT